MLTDRPGQPSAAERDDNRLGRFLRARRETIKPEDVGFARDGRRRVPGLRREELALLAGVSSTYYMRLEQGQSRRPSQQVLEALAHALQLDDDARRHLLALAQPAVAEPDESQPETVRPELGSMLERHLDTPAFVLGRCMDVLAANPVAGALHPSFTAGRNILRDLFLDRSAQMVYRDVTSVQRHAVGSLRAAAGALPDDAGVHELVTELTAGSEAFRGLWARHEVRNKIAGSKHFDHPVVGDLRLDYESFNINGTDRQQLIVYHAEPHTRQAQMLTLLREMVRDADPDIASPLH